MAAIQVQQHIKKNSEPSRYNKVVDRKYHERFESNKSRKSHKDISEELIQKNEPIDSLGLSKQREETKPAQNTSLVASPVMAAKAASSVQIPKDVTIPQEQVQSPFSASEKPSAQYATYSSGSQSPTSPSMSPYIPQPQSSIYKPTLFRRPDASSPVSSPMSEYAKSLTQEPKFQGSTPQVQSNEPYTPDFKSSESLRRKRG